MVWIHVMDSNNIYTLSAVCIAGASLQDEQMVTQQPGE
jgi:hypothetical protein